MSEQVWPRIDDRVHVWIDGQGCHPGTVEQRILDAPTDGNVVALSIKTDRRVADCSHRISRDYDPEMQASGSWHWPHDHAPPKLPSLNIEALARLDLRPDEILAVTYGVPGLTVDQCVEVQEWLTGWLADHGQPVAGVLVLPQGSQLAALRAPEPVTHEQVMRGEKSINDYRRYLGMPKFNLGCAALHFDPQGNPIPCPGGH